MNKYSNICHSTLDVTVNKLDVTDGQGHMKGIYFVKLSMVATSVWTYCIHLYNKNLESQLKELVKEMQICSFLHHLNRNIVRKISVGPPMMSDVGPLLVQFWYEDG